MSGRVRGASPDRLTWRLATVPASPRATGPVRALSPLCRELSREAPSSGRAFVRLRRRLGRAGPRAWADEGDQVVGPVRERGVIQRAAPFSRSPPARRPSRPPAPVNAPRQDRTGAVTPKQQSSSRARSRLVPVKVIAGRIASGIAAPQRRAGSRTAAPSVPRCGTTSRPDARRRSRPARRHQSAKPARCPGRRPARVRCAAPRWERP